MSLGSEVVEIMVDLASSTSTWLVDEAEHPVRALGEFSAMEQKRILSFESLALAPLYLLMAAEPTSPRSIAVRRSWWTVLLLAVVFGSIGSTFGFYFFDIFMARCIAHDATVKARHAVTHSILLCFFLGAPYGWVSNKLTGLVSRISTYQRT
ncbi:hypothetical protein GUITHDRAFT_109926 [Guillardia theta CCMP2712]|uniref:Uncharacterized protein n=2 Tax=Guillardia theta TaxID=55529 RepID=L1J6H4_GUITC|nr:hypothetical protein GUITHDRAFT_109926 [Guillardia theta CCMP2712]EKX44143.1 hypothetical protein GUITHDRAFT_109926 [Guillardia theta CCMP2712]|eukprot:XP_005831123.1 hypothetical protein GUITHDRAFT_109926 [Guillardia theta CCMP2712]